MKNKLLFLLLLLSGMAGAQVVNIPDAVFKNRLLNASTSNGIAKDSSGNNMLIDINDDNEIQVIEAQAVWDLNVSNGGVQSMEGIQAFTNLRNLVCTNNDDLTELNLQGMTNLVTLDLTHNSLANLVCTGCTALVDLISDRNDLTTLDFTGLSNLQSLSCNGNNLTTLDLTGLSNLESLSCKSCGLTQIDLSPVNLNRFIGGYNPFTSVDFSLQSNLHTFSLMGCGDLTSVYLKNGSVQSMFAGEPFYDCPNLAYICLDEEEVLDAYISNIPHIENVVFSTTCDGNGNENNHIIGAVKFDANNNGCDNSDPIHSFIKVKSDHDGNSSSSWTNAYGYYCHIAGIGIIQFLLILKIHLILQLHSLP